MAMAMAMEWGWIVGYKYAKIKLPEVEKSQTSETHKSEGGNFKRPKRNQRNCYRYLTVYWCVALAEFIGLVFGHFHASFTPFSVAQPSTFVEMEMQNVKLEKRAKRLKLIWLGCLVAQVAISQNANCQTSLYGMLTPFPHLPTPVRN